MPTHGRTPEDEEEQARAWLARHVARYPELEGASLPQDHYRDPVTGETVEHEQSAYLAGDGAGRSGEEHRGLLSYSRSKKDLSEMFPDDGRVLLGRGQRSRAEMDVRIRLDRAMAELREDQQDLLRRRFFEAMTFEDMARELHVSKQAVQYKTRNAVQDLYVAIARTWNLPYDVVEEVFGVRLAAGRPGRDRDGEEDAANMAIESFYAARERRTHDD